MIDKTALNAELAALNAAVDAALKARKDWMDAHMEAYSEFKVGDEIYDIRTGERMGVVSKLYRYQARHNPIYDTSMSVDVEFTNNGWCFDNTSRYGGSRWFGTKDQMRRHHEILARAG